MYETSSFTFTRFLVTIKSHTSYVICVFFYRGRIPFCGFSFQMLKKSSDSIRKNKNVWCKIQGGTNGNNLIIIVTIIIIIPSAQLVELKFQTFPGVSATAVVRFYVGLFFTNSPPPRLPVLFYSVLYTYAVCAYKKIPYKKKIIKHATSSFLLL